MNALTHRALAALPMSLQQAIRGHAYADDIAELVSECWIELASMRAGDTLEDAFQRARSRVRRFSQDPAHYACSIDAVAEAAQEAEEPSALRYADYVSDIQQQQKCTRRRAQQIAKAAVAHAAQGDLFAAAGGAV